MSSAAILLTLLVNGVIGFFWLRERSRNPLHRSRVDAFAIGVAFIVNVVIILPSPSAETLRSWLAAAVVGGILAAIVHLIWSARERAAHRQPTDWVR
ncbi:MAG: hypothetical protein OEV00_00520 [Acidobacteriota bacterium]|nr:hypothetical protein [Acidobacteriota bacterium]MDH3783787.1 hypothetical protein [Acidobacteriota bacterium]